MDMAGVERVTWKEQTNSLVNWLHEPKMSDDNFLACLSLVEKKI